MSPVFAHGQLRLYLLALLDEGPRHGYEVIQELERRFEGLYSPSAGTVYPRLAKLEEEGLVERTDEGRKATYRITDSGRREVHERHTDLEDLRSGLDMSVRALAEDVRTRVQGQARDLRAELAAAAREARATATPLGGPEWKRDRRGREWAWDLEDLVTEVRDLTRRAWRSQRLTPEQQHEIRDILADTANRVLAVVNRR
jgi:DNA-binding PadR family transcriptional regulator